MAMYTIIEINNDHLNEIAGNPNVGVCIARICRAPTYARRIREDYSIPNVIRVVGQTGDHVYAGHTKLNWMWKPPMDESVKFPGDVARDVMINQALGKQAGEAFRKFCEVTNKLPKVPHHKIVTDGKMIDFSGVPKPTELKPDRILNVVLMEQYIKHLREHFACTDDTQWQALSQDTKIAMGKAYDVYITGVE